MKENNKQTDAPVALGSNELLGVKVNYTREELIDICERAVVPIDKWFNRDTPSAQEGVGRCWVMLRAGADFTVHPARGENEASGCWTDDSTVWITLHWHNFNDFEYGTKFGESDRFYLPTPKRLEESMGGDWY